MDKNKKNEQNKPEEKAEDDDEDLGSIALDPLGGEDEEYEKALTETGFGKFNIHILIYCGFLYSLAAIGLTALSFVLPAAVNEFNLTSTNKGILVAMPMVGMLFGSYFWGSLASLKGRWITILSSLIMDGICGIVSIFAPNLQIFCAIRFLNGFAISGTMDICFPYLGEFQPIKYRERMLCWLELFWVIGFITLPGIAYGIIPLDFYYETDGFVFTSWKLYLIICALPNFILALWIICFPESPKFLVEHDETELARNILLKIFRINSGLPNNKYPVMSVRRHTHISVHKIHSQLYVTTKKLRLYKWREFKLLMHALVRYTQKLFIKKYILRTLLLFGIQFGLTCSYFTLMLWFPELFNRYKIYERLEGNTDTSICHVSKVLLERKDEVAEIQGTITISDDVYLKTVYLGLACIPLSVLYPSIVHKVGSRILLGVGLLADSISVFLVLIAHTEMQNLILSCICKFLASISCSVLYGITVDLYPAKIRIIAVALGMSIGRLAALLGNLVFGYLIDTVCYFPFAMFGCFLLVGAILSFFLPNPYADQTDRRT